MFKLHGPRAWLLVGFVSFQTIVATAGEPLLLKMLIDTIELGALRPFVVIGIAALVFHTACRILDYTFVMMKARLRLQIMSDYSAKSTELYFLQPYAEVSERDNGYYGGRIYDEAREISGVLDAALDGYRALVATVVALGVCVWLSWQLALAVSAVTPFLLYLSWRFGSRIAKSSEELQEAEAQLRDTLAQVVGSYKVANLFPSVSLPHQVWSNAVGRTVRVRLGFIRYSSLFGLASGIALSYAEMAMLVAAGFFVIIGELTVGGLFAFMGAYWRAIHSVRSIVGLVPQLAKLDGVLKRFEAFAVEATVTEQQQTSGTKSSGPVLIDLKDIFVTLGEKVVLDGLSTNFRRGERVLVVGANGAGKSTLVDVICGLRVPTLGKASVPGRGVVSCQFTEPCFFPGTVGDNLKAANPAKVLYWLERAELSDFADRSPSKLSVGQQRKLQIAMTLARDCECYVFDEPLTGLDDRSKSVFLNMLFDCTVNRTLIVVLHGEPEARLRFDRVLDLDSGNASRKAAHAVVM